MKKAYFLADLHLGAQAGDSRHESERSAVAFLDSIKGDAREVYLLGDILDYWFEYRHVVPRGFVRFFGKLAELADSGVKITWLIGNHDIWIFDYLPAELGLEVYDGTIEREILGTSFLMQHGDAVGGTRKFRFMRAMFRNRICQWLYSGIHPRWTVGFAHGCSRRSRANDKEGMADRNLDAAMEKWCEDRIKDGDKARYFVFGHLHREVRRSLPEGREMIVLPPWSIQRGYGVYDGEKFEIRSHGNG